MKNNKKNRIPRPVMFSRLARRFGQFCTVRNLSPAGNQLLGSCKHEFVVQFRKGEVFQSYGVIVGAKIYSQTDETETLFLSDFHDYSRTTSHYCKKWCGLDAEARRPGLDNGKIRALLA